MTIAAVVIVVIAVIALFAAFGIYLGSITGSLVIDLNCGRRVRTLGPLRRDIVAPADTVYGLLSQPYLGRLTHAMANKVHVIDRGHDMVLAAHRTGIRGHLVATTIETVKFTDERHIEFRLVRGPVPQVTETFAVTPTADGCTLSYDGELGTDLGSLGAWWGRIVARHWEATVAATMDAVQAEAQRRPSRP
jgi:hypothetical protein